MPYHAKYISLDEPNDLGHGWQVFSTGVTTHPTPIASCRTEYVAYAIRDALNAYEKEKDNVRP